MLLIVAKAAKKGCMQRNAFYLAQKKVDSIKQSKYVQVSQEKTSWMNVFVLARENNCFFYSTKDRKQLGEITWHGA